MLYIGTDIKSDRALMAKSTLGWVKPKLLLPDRSLLLADGKQVFVLKFERYLSSFLSFSFFLSFLSFFLSFVLSFFHCSPPCSSCWVEFGPKALVLQKKSKNKLICCLYEPRLRSVYLNLFMRRHFTRSLIHSFIYLFIRSLVLCYSTFIWSAIHRGFRSLPHSRNHLQLMHLNTWEKCEI